jgi:carboxymethylenebutenolidase
MERRIEANGHATTLYLAKPSRGSGTPVLLFHAWWGLNDDVRAFADRLARSGFLVAAPDLYQGTVATSIEEAERISGEMDEDFGDAAALVALDALLGEAGARQAVTIGFSLGAMWAVWLAGIRPEVVASVTYYGAVWGRSGNGTLRLTQSRAPILSHFAANDRYETEEGIAAFEKGCREMGRDLEVHRYPATEHWFAEPSQRTYARGPAALAFDRTIAFLNREPGRLSQAANG